MFKHLHVSDLIFYKKSVEDIIDFLRKNEIENLEFFIEPLDEEYTRKMSEVLEKYEFKSISFHGPFRRCRLTDKTEKGWNDVIYSYTESLKIAKKYGASFMVLHSNEKLTEPVQKEMLEERIKTLVELGKEYSVDIVVENVGIKEDMVFDQNSYEKLILENNYSSLIDIGHAFLNNWNIPELISKLKENIKGYHFHNNNGFSDEHRPISCGEINYNEIVELYKKHTPNAKIVLEYDFTESAEQLLEDVKHLNSRLEK